MSQYKRKPKAQEKELETPEVNSEDDEEEEGDEKSEALKKKRKREERRKERKEKKTGGVEEESFLKKNVENFVGLSNCLVLVACDRSIHCVPDYDFR